MKKDKDECDKARVLKYLIASIILCGISFAIVYFDAAKAFMALQFKLTPGTYLYYLWLKPAVPLIFNIYLFNITNAEAFLSGEDKKIMYQQIGPYAFRETYEDKNITFHDNDTVSYTIQRTYNYLPEKSSGDLYSDRIITTNVILLCASTMASRTSSVVALGFAAIASDVKPILNLSVNEYLYGYDDKILNLGSNVLPWVTPFKKFGFFDQFIKGEENHMLTTTLKDVYEADKEEIKVPSTTPAVAEILESKNLDVEYEEESMENEEKFEVVEDQAQAEDAIKPKLKPAKTLKLRDYSIELWNGSPFLPNWDKHGMQNKNKNHSNCNRIGGTFDGFLYSKKVKKTDRLDVYRKSFCRRFPFYYSHTQELLKGVEIYWFETNEESIHDDLENPLTSCYCDKLEKCYKRGLGNVAPCYHGLPLSLSQPHFFKADPSLLDQFDGLKPIKEKHETVIGIQPQLGINLNFKMRTQMNLMMGQTKFNEAVKKFDDMAIPLGWIENILDDLSPAIEFHLQMGLVVLPIVMAITAVLTGISGLFCMYVVFKLHFRERRKNHFIYDDGKKGNLKELKLFLSSK